MLNDMYDVSAVIELLIIILEPTEFGVDFEGRYLMILCRRNKN